MGEAKTEGVTVEIQAPKAGSPSHLLARVELQFTTGLMAGIRMTGIALWKAQGQNGAFISVTFPALSIPRNEGGTVYFDHLRGNAEDMKRLKGAIVAAYREYAREKGLELTEDAPAAGSEGQAEATPF